MLVILIIGIVIIMFSAVIPDSDRKSETAAEDYVGEEERLGEILSEISGAGRVSVMISYENGDNGSSGIGRSMSYGDNDDRKQPRGVIVVADGAEVPEVRRSLKEAASAVMGVGANRVCVYDRDINK